MDELNIRSTEERYGGEGHAGTDPFAGQQLSGSSRQSADPSLEVPDATIADLTTLPNSDLADLNSPEPATGQQSDNGAQSGPDQSKAAQVKEKADAMAHQAGDKADAGMQKSAEGLKKAADMARSASEDLPGPVGMIGTQTAGALEKGAGYLEKGDTEQMLQDLEALVRQRPVESLLVAAAAGFIVSKAMR